MGLKKYVGKIIIYLSSGKQHELENSKIMLKKFDQGVNALTVDPNLSVIKSNNGGFSGSTINTNNQNYAKN
jgi:hypothetical protein